LFTLAIAKAWSSEYEESEVLAQKLIKSGEPIAVFRGKKLMDELEGFRAKREKMLGGNN